VSPSVTPVRYMDIACEAMPPHMRDVGSSHLANLALKEKFENHCVQSSLLVKDLARSEAIYQSQALALTRLENVIRRCRTVQGRGGVDMDDPKRVYY
jgi:hypothetical protein